MTGRALLRLLAIVAAAVTVTLASSVVAGTRMEVQDWECPPVPASCARPVQVRGFPMPYISDYHGVSVVGRADLVGALRGEDLFHAPAFLANVALYAVAFAGVWTVAARARRRRAVSRAGEGLRL